jgi:hypothetical protein
MGPIWVGILAFFILYEPYTTRDAAKAVISLIGLILVVKPAFIWSIFSDEIKL